MGARVLTMDDVLQFYAGHICASGTHEGGEDLLYFVFELGQIKCGRTVIAGLGWLVSPRRSLRIVGLPNNEQQTLCLHPSHVDQSLLARGIWLDHGRLRKQGRRGKALALSRRGKFDVANKRSVEGVGLCCGWIRVILDADGRSCWQKVENFCRCCSGANPDNNGIMAEGWMEVEGQGGSGQSCNNDDNEAGRGKDNGYYRCSMICFAW